MSRSNFGPLRAPAIRAAAIGWLAVALAAFSAEAGAQGERTESPAGQDPDAVLGALGEVRVRVREIYDGVPEEERFLPRVIQALHWTTREEVVRKEVWLAPGAAVTQADLDELARKLRRLGIFAEVRVALAQPGADGRRDLEIDVRDRSTIIATANASLVGEVASFFASVGEQNLFGRGDELFLDVARNTDGEHSGGVSFTDRHVFGEWVRLSGFGRVTEEGERAGLRLFRPPRQLAEPLEWSLGVSGGSSEVDFFELGDSVAEVPLDELVVDASAARGFGTRRSYWQLGGRVTFADERFGAARGPQAGRIDVPGDTTRIAVGPFVGFEHTQRFDTARRLDTVGFVQDLRLGSGWELFAGGERRAEDERDDAWEPLVRARGYAALAPLEATYVTLELHAERRWRTGDRVLDTQGGALHAFHLAPGGHTLAGSVTYDDVFEGEGLPLELTLGEDNGLRGYPAREFSGTRRVRVNLEERFDAGLEWRTFRLGLVAFADAGWVGEEDAGLGAPLRSLGLGLRLGSSEIYGANVFRIDLAFPLDDREGLDYGPLLSASLGQVFSFFGNDSVLSTR